jgi:hypothetical protein
VRRNADGAYDFVFYFDTLRLEEPVKYGLSALEINQSKFSDDVNKCLAEFIKSDFPKYLRARGESPEIVNMARIKAEDAILEYLRRNVFALFGDLGGKIGRVDMVFNTAAFDDFAPDLSIKIGTVQPVTGVKSDGK